jgi:hypothetical protein
MRKLSVVFLFLLAQAFVFAGVKGQEKISVFEIPLKYISFQLLTDPKCPLQLSNPRVLGYKNGNLDYYTISNNSDKSVKSFRIKAFSAFVNPSEEHTPNAMATDELSFVPYESFSTLPNENKFEIAEFSEKQAVEFGLSERCKRIWIVIVTKVELYDGTVYDATSKYFRIIKYIERIENEEFEADDETTKLAAEEKEAKLRIFINENVQKN